MATEWKKVKFNQIFAEPTRNGLSETSSKENDGLKIINMGEVFGYDFISCKQEMRKLPSNKRVNSTFVVKNNDLLFARRSLVESGAGKVSLIKDANIESTVFESSIIRVRLDDTKVLPLFYFYWLKSFYGRAAISPLITGINVKGIRASELAEITVPLPPLETQLKIAGILSAYDDLIENNHKQIKLLEEAAQKLYKEWFVKLNFPGHENTKIVDGVPEGWKKGTVFDLGEFKRGKTITKDQTILGPVPVVAGGLEPAYYHNESNTDSPVITVSGSGANAGFTRMYYEKVWASDCSYLDISKCENLYFVYCILKNSKAEIENLQKGAAQPHVYAKDVNDINTLIPCQELLEKFSAVVKAYFEKIRAVQKQIIDLQSARDKLLPKLMNGELI